MTDVGIKEIREYLSEEETKEAFAKLDAVAVYIEKSGEIRLWDPSHLVSRCTTAHAGDPMDYKRRAVSQDKYIPVLEESGLVRFMLAEYADKGIVGDYREKVKKAKESGKWQKLVEEMRPGGGRGPDGILEADRVETIARIDQEIGSRKWGGERKSLGAKVRAGVKEVVKGLKQRPSF